VSVDGGASFCDYSVRPVDLSTAFWDRIWGDSHLGIGKDMLFIAVNMHLPGGAFDRKMTLRWPLDLLRQCAQFSFQYLNGSTTLLHPNFIQ
jgi:hypothetical protein